LSENQSEEHNATVWEVRGRLVAVGLLSTQPIWEVFSSVLKNLAKIELVYCLHPVILIFTSLPYIIYIYIIPFTCLWTPCLSFFEPHFFLC
jgi:hypothetical protein